MGLDKDLRPVGMLPCIHIQWNRRYYEAGDFTLQLRAVDFNASIVYVYTFDRPETGRVAKVETEHTIKGDLVQVSGFFLEGALNWKIVWPRAFGEGNLADACRALVAFHMVDTGVTVPSGVSMGDVAAFDVTGEPLGTTTYALLRLQSLSQRIRLDYSAGTMVYEVWQGLDRTQGQSTNAYAVFSQSFGTADEVILTTDDSAWRNVAIATYEGGAITVDVRAEEALPARVLFVQTGLALESGQTQAALLSAVRAQALVALSAYGQLVNIEATVLQANIRYLVDYDLGDLCDVRDDRLGLAFEARIVEVNEVFKQNTHTVSLTFGDKLPTSHGK